MTSDQNEKNVLVNNPSLKDQSIYTKVRETILGNYFPEGWEKELRPYFNLLQEKYGVVLTGSYIWKGIFVPKFKPPESLIEYQFHKVLVGTVARRSSYVCMICGQRGKRKKEVLGWPCLCKLHYIEYLNSVYDTEGR